MINSLLVSLNDNILKLSLIDSKGFKCVAMEVPKDTANGSKILNTQTVSQNISDFLDKSKKPILNFLVEPQDVILKFVTVSKKGGEVEDQVLSEIKTKLDRGVVLGDLYFSYQKIAPFVYQFVGIRKEVLEKYTEIANNLNLELKYIVPWILLLPKYVNNEEIKPNDPCIFVSKNLTEWVVALSELNGIYFSAVYEEQKEAKDLQKLVSELSVYKRPLPITKIYTVGTEVSTKFLSPDPAYEVTSLHVDGVDSKESQDFELHMLFNKMLNEKPELFIGQLNLLNLFPLPEVQNKKSSLVYIGAAAGSLLLVGLIVAGVLSNNAKSKPKSSEMAQSSSSTGSPNVLSQESSISVPAPVVSALKRGDLRVKVLNGAGVGGIAAKARDFLNGLGYTVVEIGNSDNQTYSTTLLSFKASKKAYENILFNDMQKSYTVSMDEKLGESATFDVLVIIGSK